MAGIAAHSPICAIRPARYTSRMKNTTVSSLWALGGADGGVWPGCDVIGDPDAPTPTSSAFDRDARRQAVGVADHAHRAVFPASHAYTRRSWNPVGPNATATAAIATIQAATLTAAAPAPAPYFQPTQCPAAGFATPAPPPPDFNDYSVVIGRYLSAGGPPTVLEATLRNWGAITDTGGVVQANTDLTGDGVLEVIVTVYNPAVYNAEALLNAGQLLVYGCDSGRLPAAPPDPVQPRIGAAGTAARGAI